MAIEKVENFPRLREEKQWIFEAVAPKKTFRLSNTFLLDSFSPFFPRIAHLHRVRIYIFSFYSAEIVVFLSISPRQMMKYERRFIPSSVPLLLFRNTQLNYIQVFNIPRCLIFIESLIFMKLMHMLFEFTVRILPSNDFILVKSGLSSNDSVQRDFVVLFDWLNL